ncbi:hypothetical protein [Brevibacillus agri]
MALLAENRYSARYIHLPFQESGFFHSHSPPFMACHYQAGEVIRPAIPF